MTAKNASTTKGIVAVALASALAMGADADDYVVTIVSWWGDWWEVRVDAETGCAWCIF